MTAYYNENDAYAAGWLRNLIAERLIADGEVDTRSIADVCAADLAGFGQCHFFAGIGGWSLALRAAGWPDARPVWTGSCPCQPFSLLGKQTGYSDPRHLWPTWARLIRERRPATVFGEQLATAPRWLRLVRSDLEALGYAVGALPVEAACAGAFHLRDRYWFVADRYSERAEPAGARHRRGGEASEARDDAGGRGALVYGIEPGLEGHAWHGDHAREESFETGSAAEAGFQFGGAVADRAGFGSGSGFREDGSQRDGHQPADGGAGRDVADAFGSGGHRRPALAWWGSQGRTASGWDGERDGEIVWCIGPDKKVRPAESGIRLVADGVPARVDQLRALGNAIDHRPAAAFIRAAMQSIGG